MSADILSDKELSALLKRASAALDDPDVGNHDLQGIIEDLDRTAEELDKRRGVSEAAKTFYCTKVSIQVLSEEPIEELDLDSVCYGITNGSLVGAHLGFDRKGLTPKETAEMLYAFGSDPGFFQLDDEGNALGDE